MLRCVAYKEAMKAEWDRFALANGTIYHTTGFQQVLVDSFGYSSLYHAVVDTEDRICAIIPLIVGRNLGLRKVGVSLPFTNYMDLCAINEEVFQFAIESIQQIKNRSGLHYIELRLKDESLNSPEWNLNDHNHTFVLALSEGEDKVLAMSSSSNRNHVRKVYKNDWFDVSFDPRHLDKFYQVYVRRMKQLGSPAQAISFFKRLFDYLPEHAFLLTVLDKQTGAVAGGMILLTNPSNSTVYYPYGANLSEYNNKYLNNFMYWEAVRFGIRNGYQYLDLGRSQTGSGTYKYKEQWGAKAEKLSYLVYSGGQQAAGAPDKQSLQLFIDLWKVIPSFITNPVGRILIKYLLP
ncbi:MAG: FemAB-related protein system-associated [Paenibacillus sp.]|nr:FemAB-related protein system-associated [Paenibacillus sp.]